MGERRKEPEARSQMPVELAACTTAGTSMVKDVVPGSGSSNPAGLTAIGDRLFFDANDSGGAALWVKDSTNANPSKLYQSPQVDSYDRFFNVDGTLFCTGFGDNG